MDYERFDPRFNFSRLNATELSRQKITMTDIISVFHNPRSKLFNLEGFDPQDYFFKMVGFSSNSRPLKLALRYKDDEIIFHQVEIANEDDIQRDYCGQ